MESTTASDSFEIERIGVLGAKLSPETLDQMRHALATHQVLFFQGQNLSGDEQLDLARQFGEIVPERAVFSPAGR